MKTGTVTHLFCSLWTVVASDPLSDPHSANPKANIFNIIRFVRVGCVLNC